MNAWSKLDLIWNFTTHRKWQRGAMWLQLKFSLACMSTFTSCVDVCCLLNRSFFFFFCLLSIQNKKNLLAEPALRLAPSLSCVGAQHSTDAPSSSQDTYKISSPNTLQPWANHNWSHMSPTFKHSPILVLSDSAVRLAREVRWARRGEAKSGRRECFLGEREYQIRVSLTCLAARSPGTTWHCG